MPLYVEPQAGPAPIVQVIQQAHRMVDLEVYYLSDRPILRALAAAKRRGVDVRVIVEGKPYGMKPWQVRKEEKAIEATGATLHLAPYRFTSQGDRYAFMHAKYVCNGHECEIGTANFDWSAFHRNREYLYDTSNRAVVQAANAVFTADWNNRRAPYSAHDVLVLSPGTSAGQLLQVIRQPGPISVESEELGPYRPILDALAAKGKDLFWETSPRHPPSLPRKSPDRPLIALLHVGFPSHDFHQFSQCSLTPRLARVSPFWGMDQSLAKVSTPGRFSARSVGNEPLMRVMMRDSIGGFL
jgi:hypothetical protein